MNRWVRILRTEGNLAAAYGFEQGVYIERGWESPGPAEYGPCRSIVALPSANGFGNFAMRIAGRKGKFSRLQILRPTNFSSGGGEGPRFFSSPGSQNVIIHRFVSRSVA